MGWAGIGYSNYYFKLTLFEVLNLRCTFHATRKGLALDSKNSLVSWNRLSEERLGYANQFWFLFQICFDMFDSSYAFHAPQSGLALDFKNSLVS